MSTQVAQEIPQEEAENDEMLEEYSYASMFGTAEVFAVETDDGVPLRMLYVDGGFQSASYLGERRFEPPFAYCRAFDSMFGADRSPKRVLLLGGGAYSYPKHLLTQHPDVCMDVVEIDPVIVDIARKHFFVDELEALCGNCLHSFVQDGFAFLQDAEPGAYDAMINDSFVGTVADAPLLSSEGLRLAKRALSENGLYLLNLAVEEEAEELEEGAEVEEVEEGPRDAFEPRDALEPRDVLGPHDAALSGEGSGGGLLSEVYATLESVFDTVCAIRVEDEDFCGCVNYVFLASDENVDILLQAKGHFSR